MSETKLAIVKCPLLSLLIQRGIAKEPIYIEKAESSCALEVEASHLLLIPQDWTIEEGEAWLRKDAKEWLEHESGSDKFEEGDQYR